MADFIKGLEMSYNHEEALKLFDEFCTKHANSLTDDMRKAVQFALEAHKGQVRKVNGAPYVSHLFDVAEILLNAKASENLVIAGILHDIIEDTSFTDKDILALFPSQKGQAILHIILADNESDKSASWMERKTETITYAQNSDDEEGLLLICADKISNLSSLVENMEICGEMVWKYFNSPKDKQIWYYESLFKVFEKKLAHYPHLICRYQNMLNLIA